MEDGSEWPRISIVTPSYNQDRFIEETIRSVLLQGYPNLEYIVIDGGSTDNSVEIIEKYEPWLTYWVSAPDRGQSHAINKGFERVGGDLLAYINSDDVYLPRAFQTVARWKRTNPEGDWVTGAMWLRDMSTGRRRLVRTMPVNDLCVWLSGGCSLSQPATFWSRTLWEEAAKFREDLTVAFDREFWVRLVKRGYRCDWLEAELAVFRLHEQSKSFLLDSVWAQELPKIHREHREGLSSRDEVRLERLLRLPTSRKYRNRAMEAADRGEVRAALAWLWKMVRTERRVLRERATFGSLRRVAAGFALSGLRRMQGESGRTRDREQ